MNRGQSQLKQIIDQIKIEIMINIRIDQNATRTISKLSINYPDRDIVISSILLKGNGKKQERENGLSWCAFGPKWEKEGKRREERKNALLRTLSPITFSTTPNWNEKKEKKCFPGSSCSVMEKNLPWLKSGGNTIKVPKICII